jgi:hypothetical protein
MMRWTLVGCAVLVVNAQDDDTMIISRNVRSTEATERAAFYNDFLAGDAGIPGLDVQGVWGVRHEQALNKVKDFLGEPRCSSSKPKAQQLFKAFAELYDHGDGGTCTGVSTIQQFSSDVMQFAGDTGFQLVYDDGAWTGADASDVASGTVVTDDDQQNYVIIKVDTVEHINMMMTSDEGGQNYMSNFFSAPFNSDYVQNLTSHGCWCSHFQDFAQDVEIEGARGRAIIDAKDGLCKEWFIARHCARRHAACNDDILQEYNKEYAVALKTLDGDQSATTAADSFTSFSCLNNANGERCERAACELDSHYVQKLEEQMRLEYQAANGVIEWTHCDGGSIEGRTLVHQDIEVPKQKKLDEEFPELTTDEVAMLQELEDGVQHVQCHQYNTIIENTQNGLSIQDWSYVGNSLIH